MAHLFVEVNDGQGAGAGWKPISLHTWSALPLNGSAYGPNCATSASEPRQDKPPDETCDPNSATTTNEQRQNKPPAETSHTPLAVLAAVSRAGLRRTWALLAGAQACVTINGRPVVLGIRVLDDRDRILLDGPSLSQPALAYFSGEEPAVVAPFPGPEAVICPRCKMPIEPGEPAVRCPACDFWHHQIEVGESLSGAAPGAAEARPDAGTMAAAEQATATEAANEQRPAEQRRARPCWTYLDRCANCGTARPADGALSWTPDEL